MHIQWWAGLMAAAASTVWPDHCAAKHACIGQHSLITV